MSSVLPPPGYRLGVLALETVYEYYDGPVLFSARDDLGHAYLAVAVEQDTLLYVPVSEDRLVAVRTGLVALDAAFGTPESKTVFVVRPESDEQPVVEIPASEIPADWVPAANEWLTESAHTVEEFSDEKLRLWAVRQQRPMSAIRLDQADALRNNEFPLRRAGELMQELQELAEVIATEITPTAARQPEALRDAEMGLLQVAAGSVVFVVAPLLGDRMTYGPSPVMARLSDVIRAAHDGIDPFTVTIGTFRLRRTIAHIRDFFEAISDSGTGVTLTNASPSGTVTAVSVSLDRLRQSLEVLRARTDLPSIPHHVVGHLMAINLLRSTFSVVEAKPTGTRKSPRRFSGTLDPGPLSQSEGLTVGESTTYRFVILEEREVSEFTDEPERPRYRLVEIERVSPASLDEGTSTESRPSGPLAG